jgi:hypothetical protein
MKRICVCVCVCVFACVERHGIGLHEMESGVRVGKHSIGVRYLGHGRNLDGV